MKMKMWGTALIAAAACVAISSTASAGEKKLSGDEISALITNKTVSVTRKKDGKKWKMFFGADGKAYESADAPTGDWKVDGNKQCSMWINGPAKCTHIVDLGGGKYARKSGKKLFVTWDAFADGKQL